QARRRGLRVAAEDILHRHAVAARPEAAGAALQVAQEDFRRLPGGGGFGRRGGHGPSSLTSGGEAPALRPPSGRGPAAGLVKTACRGLPPERGRRRSTATVTR